MATDKEFKDDAAGWAQRLAKEFGLARKELESWWRSGDEIDKEFRNEVAVSSQGESRLNVFTANVQAMMAMLYGQTPKATVSRRYADAADDEARVSAELLERLLNTDIARDSDTYAVALRCALTDRLLPGMGAVRVRYVADFEAAKDSDGNPLPKVADEETGEEESPQAKSREDVEVDYLPWKDQLWGPAKVFHLVPWWASKHPMTREKLVERFGEEIGNAVPLNAKKTDERSSDPQDRADVWEVWHKESKRVIWYVEGHPTALDLKDDPLGLDGFWPFEEPMFANLTTSKVVPRPDYALHKDQYDKVHALATRINELVEEVRVSGVYDGANEEIPRMLTEAGRNKMIAVKNWHSLAEAGGLKGAVDWFPLDMVVQAIAVLQERLQVEMDLLFQVTGWSDIMRGEATQAGATATEQRVKAKSGSVRVQSLQDDFARFATGTLRKKAQIIAKHFDVATILERSNAKYMGEDPAVLQRAAELIKSDIHCYRVEVKPEAVALQDFSALKQDSLEVLTAIGTQLQVIAGLAQQVGPQGALVGLELLQASLAGLKGGSRYESILDRAIKQLETATERAAANPQPQQVDPKVQAAQIKLQGDQQKGQMDLQREQAKLQADLVRKQADVQAHAQQEQTQREQNVLEAAQKQMVTNTLRPEPAPRSKQWP